MQHVVQEKKLLQSDGKNSTSHENNVDQPQSGLSVILRRGRNIIRRKSNVISLDSLDEIRNRFVQRPSTIEKTFPFLMRTSIRTWRDRNTGEDYNLSEVLEEFGEKLVVDLPSWYTDITSRVPVGAIRTQRLFDFRVSGEGESQSPVKELANILSDDIKNRINSKITESAIQFQRKEKTFPHRILEGNVKAASEAALRQDYIELQSRIGSLEEVGLQESSDSLVLPRIKLNPTHRRVLTLYLADANEKLDVFNDLYRNIQLLTSLLSKKFRRKRFSIDRHHGFSIVSPDDPDVHLKPSDLSSGEKHQLVMLYELIFSDKDEQLFLIDEPEISLHVEWQRQFLDDLQKIAERRGHRFVIATHSPQIINGQRGGR